MSRTIRQLWVCGLILLVACAGTPNTQATQTRTSEIVELTVSARVLPTQNAAVPPTPVPVASAPAPVASATPAGGQAGAGPNPGSASATALWATINAKPTSPSSYAFGGPSTSGTANQQVIYGSWVAFSQTLDIRFFAPPSLVEAPDLSNDHRYSLSSPSNVYDFEALDIYRYVGQRGGDFVQTWTHEMDSFRTAPNVSALVTTNGPNQQQVGAYQGNVGQFHYFQKDNDQKVSGTMWVGQIGGDEAIIIYRCTPDRESQLDTEIAQVLRTIDFNAR